MTHRHAPSARPAGRCDFFSSLAPRRLWLASYRATEEDLALLKLWACSPDSFLTTGATIEKPKCLS